MRKSFPFPVSCMFECESGYDKIEMPLPDVIWRCSFRILEKSHKRSKNKNVLSDLFLGL